MSEPPVSIFDTPELLRKGELMQAIIEALAHYPRDLAMQVIMGWMTVEDLEVAAPTICGRDV